MNQLAAEGLPFQVGHHVEEEAVGFPGVGSLSAKITVVMITLAKTSC